MRTEPVTVPDSRPASPQLANVHGFVMTAGGVAPTWPLTARVTFANDDGSTEETTLRVRLGASYLSARVMLAVYLHSATAGDVVADVTTQPGDFIRG